MFRLTGYLRNTASSPANGRNARRRGPIVIWNLTRTCNLECAHCYSSSKNRDYSHELTTAQACKALADLKDADCFSVILSGGEPMIREDLFDIAAESKRLGLLTSLSTNGTLIGAPQAARIRATGFDYVGISLDGVGRTHDRFRGQVGSFDKALEGMRNCREEGLKVGLRFTLTQNNLPDLPAVFNLAEREAIDKIYLSHLVYSGRGKANNAMDLTVDQAREAMRFIIEKARTYAATGDKPEIVTGNNEADAVFFLLNEMERDASAFNRLLPQLKRWGGNSAGTGISNIDPLGNVHPDPLLSSVTLGNVLETPFAEIWRQNQSPVLNRLRERPRKLHGRCGECSWIEICGGGARSRAMQATGDFWGSDPSCYLTEDEIHAGAVRVS